MITVALLNAMGREGRGDRPREVVLMLAYGESGTAERGRNRLMRWRRGEISGHDLAHEPGVGEQRDHGLGEIPLPVRPVQPLIGAKRSRNGPDPSHSADSPTVAPPQKRVKMSEMEIQTSETIETLEKKNGPEVAVCQVGGLQGISSRKIRVEEEIRGDTNSSHRGRDKTPERVI